MIIQRCEPKVPSGIQAHGISGSYTHLQGNAEEFSENQRRPDPNIRTDEVALQKVGVDIAVWVLFEGESVKSMCLRHSNTDGLAKVVAGLSEEQSLVRSREKKLFTSPWHEDLLSVPPNRLCI
jgi:hypothetical protein